MKYFSSTSCVITVFIFLFRAVCCEKLEYLSFESPFTDIDNSGARLINRHWRSYGTTVVNANFARLTPDQQSKKGAVWSRKSLGVPTFSSILKFRISGKGKNFFGDGLAIWIVDQGYYTEGDLHGFQQKFTGIGIIFDTFKNTENLAAHRDVTVLVNDGEKTWDMMTADVQGCNAGFRYHSERGDFSVTDASRAKIVVSGNNLTVHIDPKNNGEWIECVALTDLQLPQEWARKAHIGITASTGQLSDNHDVLSLLTLSDAEITEVHELALSLASKQIFELGSSNMTVEDRLLRVEEMMNTLLLKLDHLDHHLEHEVVTLEDHMSGLQSKVEKLENEGIPSPSSPSSSSGGSSGDKKFDKELESRLGILEQQMKATLQSKVAAIEKTFDRKLASTAGGGGGSGWKWPFFIMVLLFLGSGVGLYFFYLRLKKIHML